MKKENKETPDAIWFLPEQVQNKITFSTTMSKLKCSRLSQCTNTEMKSPGNLKISGEILPFGGILKFRIF